MLINNKCVHCTDTGIVWRGGQGGDYEYCECEKGKAKKKENDDYQSKGVNRTQQQ